MNQKVYQLLNNAHIDAGLDLGLTSCCDIWECPTHFFPHSLLLMVNDVVQSTQRSTIYSKLGLLIIPCYYISNGPERRHWYSYVVMGKQLYNSREDICLEDHWDARLAPIRYIRHGPTHIYQNILMVILNQYLGQRRDGPLNLLEVWSGPSPAEVWKSPTCISN